MSDIDIAAADGLKVLDLKRPIREADDVASRHWSFLTNRQNIGATRDIET